MLAVVGTVPSADFPLTVGEVKLSDDTIQIDGKNIPVNRGTPALLAAAARALNVLGGPPVTGFLVGDIGLGDGSRRLYDYITRSLNRFNFSVITFHYLQPDVDWHNRVLFAVEDISERPVLIADAGFMYAAKMSGSAPLYDLFTPDVGELAFLADEAAPHPFYTRGFILHDENKVPDLIRRAYDHDNAARYLMVKGKRDYLADKGGVREAVDKPAVEAMEAMGGTGDTLTGLVSALTGTGMPVPEAATAAARINRIAGCLAEPTPASQIFEIIRHIPKAMETALRKPSDDLNDLQLP